jgi:hypothetical protein
MNSSTSMGGLMQKPASSSASSAGKGFAGKGLANYWHSMHSHAKHKCNSAMKGKPAP